MKLIKNSDFHRNLRNKEQKPLPISTASCDTTRAIDLLTRARNAWDSLQTFRRNRRRNIQYTFGDQWGDIVRDQFGRHVTERTRMMEKDGQPPMQNNHISKIERALTGLYAKGAGVPVCFARETASDEKSEMMTRALQTNWERNSEKEILTSQMSEMIVSGLPVIVEEWSTEDGIDDSYTYVVNPEYFFYESKAGDPRMWDVSLVGEIRDYDFNELVVAMSSADFGGDGVPTDPRKAKEFIRAIYDGHTTDDTSATDQMERFRYEDFTNPPDNRLCRTYRIWTREYKTRYRCIDIMDEDPMYRIDEDDLPEVEAVNKGRLATFRDLFLSQGMDPDEAQRMAEQEAPLIEYEKITDLFWQCTILSPWGDVLASFPSPYEHNSHPYVFRPHQLVNGKIYPFIATVIDQQRYINRLVTLKDMYIRSMIKGLKFIPKSLLGGMSPEQFARQAVELNGYVFYEPDDRHPNAVPQIVTQNAGQLGVEEMIALQVGWLSDISNVTNTLQGKAPAASTPATRYMMETENSTTSISALLNKFSAFERDLAMKKMKTIHQFYTEGRSISSVKTNGYMQYSTYDPKLVEDIEFDVSIRESAESPVARMMINDITMSLWQAGAINAEQLLEYSYLPGSTQILQSLRSAREQQQQAQLQQQQLMQQMQAGQPPAEDPAAIQGAQPAQQPAQAQQPAMPQQPQQVQTARGRSYGDGYTHRRVPINDDAMQDLKKIADRANPYAVSQVAKILRGRSV